MFMYRLFKFFVVFEPPFKAMVRKHVTLLTFRPQNAFFDAKIAFFHSFFIQHADSKKTFMKIAGLRCLYFLKNSVALHECLTWRSCDIRQQKHHLPCYFKFAWLQRFFIFPQMLLLQFPNVAYVINPEYVQILLHT